MLQTGDAYYIPSVRDGVARSIKGVWDDESIVCKAHKRVGIVYETEKEAVEAAQKMLEVVKCTKERGNSKNYIKE